MMTMITMTALMTTATMTTMMLMMMMTLMVRCSLCAWWFRRGRLFNAAAFPPMRAHVGVLCVRPSASCASMPEHHCGTQRRTPFVCSYQKQSIADMVETGSELALGVLLSVCYFAHTNL